MQYRRLVSSKLLLGNLLLIAWIAATGTIRAQQPFAGPRRPGPLDFLEQHDRNSDGVLSAQEQTGQAGYLLERLRRDVSWLGREGTAVSIRSIVAAYQRRREERAREAFTPANNKGANTQSRVPGFDEYVPGLGGRSSSRLSATDLREADKTLRRFDQNRDGRLDRNEVRRALWRDDPDQYDRNRDGRLSRDEIALRIAGLRKRERQLASENKREAERTTSAASISSSSYKREDRRNRKAESTRPRRESIHERIRDLVPEWYLAKDANRDGQVAMHEFSQSWSNALVAEFRRFDHNDDGLITLREMTNKEPTRQVAARPTAKPPVRSTSSRPDRPTKPAKTSSAGTSTGPSLAAVQAMEKYIGRFDTNKDGSLDKAEWSKLPRDYSYADSDQDGKITALEFVLALKSR